METGLIKLSGQWQQVAGAWLAEVGQRTGSMRTPKEYARHLERFIETVGDVTRATPPAVMAYAYGKGASGKEPSPSTIMVRLAALSGFFDFARRMGIVSTNPANDVKRPHARQSIPRGLDTSELLKLLEAVPGTPAGLRDRAIVITAVLTGLRRSELLGLRVRDLTRNGRVYYTVRAKGGVLRHRELPLPAFTAIVGALEAAGTPLESMVPDARLFDLSSQGFYANLRRYATKAGVKGVTPHALRHSAAKLRRQGGASIEDIGTLLGHRNIATTARYLQRLEGEDDNGWQGTAAALGL